MKAKIYFVSLMTVVIILGINICNSFAQEYILQCPMVSANTQLHIPSNITGGFNKPHRTDQNNAPWYATFNIIIVFVQFADDSTDADYWPIGGAPVFKDQLLSTTKDTVGDYWNRYNDSTEMLSDWYQEISKGQMHVTGSAYNVILSQSANYYKNQGMFVMNQEIIDSLKVKINNWSLFDLWSGSNGNFYYSSDGYVDMIIKAHRTRAISGLFYQDAPGFCFLGDYSTSNNFPVDTNIVINDYYSNLGSGVTIVGTAGGPLDKDRVFNIAKHEIGHYWFGLFHSGPGVGIMGGGEIYLGAWESMTLGYLTYNTVNWGITDYSLNDITSRYSNGELLQIPVSWNEYFIVANRRKISKYDRTMLGDTARGDFQRIINPDYGKGIYIYHYNNYLENDIECADGLYNWTRNGFAAPDWEPGNINLPYLIPITVSYQNHVPCFNLLWCSNYTNNKDGRDVYGYTLNDKLEANWFSTGKIQETGHIDGTDRFFVNEEEPWTSRAFAGDRWDAWNIGYNEILSPYSSPNSFSWNNDTTGIFIWYYSLNQDTAKLKILKISVSTPLDSILKWTPPSRPMGLKVDVTNCIDYRRYPVLTWNQNMEPDMEQSGTKRYKIFRAWDAMENVPGNYEEIADTLFDADTNIATFIDFDTYAQCDDGTAEENYRLRYKVKAVDIYEDISVYSDFVSISTYYLNRGDGEGGDAIFHKNLTYELSQNYPNPFNPVTNIQFSIPINGFVKLTVYDILGREVKNLINEFKHAGSYIVSFDGSALASGIYLYRIQVTDARGNNVQFAQTKRMILIK